MTHSVSKDGLAERRIIMSKNELWQVIPFILPIISYIIGKRKNAIRVPKPISALLENADAVAVVVQGIEAAETMKDTTSEQKRAYVRAWAKSELQTLLGGRLPESTINFLIEHALVRRKGRAGAGGG